jgi:hypothetical protein
MLPVNEYPVLDGDRVQFAGTHSEERQFRVFVELFPNFKTIPLARGLPQP